MGINKRLRNERERLGHSQEAFGALGGVRKQAQHMYESGTRRPDSDYLERLADAGADVLYILTGKRSQSVAEVELLPVDERTMLDNYRHAPDAVRAGIKTTLSAFTSGSKQTVRKKSA
ncbi:helix-turn-helix transcriptional regulator [Limnohabitans sp.]|uniref:helix-turn-helix domain-containing protein n=1 Tax=Limnohabitans sp. TaxID=1907725 RepID=UPI00286F5862|nr:helix-turn-helix transcriptional regulator [Limnohabitans sp.]